MTHQETNDRLATLRRVLGDELAFKLLSVGREVADRWDGPTSPMTYMGHLVQLAEAVRAAHLEAPMRDATVEWCGRTQKLANPLEDVLALVGGSAPLLEVLDEQLEQLTALRRSLAAPAARARGEKIAAP